MSAFSVFLATLILPFGLDSNYMPMYAYSNDSSVCSIEYDSELRKSYFNVHLELETAGDYSISINLPSKAAYTFDNQPTAVITYVALDFAYYSNLDYINNHVTFNFDYTVFIGFVLGSDFENITEIQYSGFGFTVDYLEPNFAVDTIYDYEQVYIYQVLYSFNEEFYDLAYQRGYDLGYGIGEDVGYQSGYDYGYDLGYGEAESLYTADWLGWIGRTLSSIMDIELFMGFTLGGIFGTCVIIAVTIWFLKMFSGG